MDDDDSDEIHINSNIEKDLKTITKWYNILIEPNKREPNITDNYIISKIKLMIDDLKQYYIQKIELHINYTKYELNNFSIEKLKEIVDNYDFYKSDKHGYINNNIDLHFDDKLKNGCFFDSLMVALFNKKNYMIEKLLFDSLTIIKTSKNTDNNLIEQIISKLKELYTLISTKKELTNIYTFNSIDYKLNSYIRILISNYLKGIDTNNSLIIKEYNDAKEQDYNEIFNFLEKIIQFPLLTKLSKNHENDSLSKKFIFNIICENNYKLINEDNVLKLNNDTTEEYIIVNSPLLFINFLVKNYDSYLIDFPEKITFENNTLYLNSIIIYNGKIIGDSTDYEGHNRCIFESNKKWYMYNNTDNPTVAEKVGDNFQDLFNYKGPGKNEIDYVRKKAVGLFYT
jgi:hypothetical protein